MKVIATAHCTITEVGGLYRVETDASLLQRIRDLEDERDNARWQRQQDADAAWRRGA